MPVLDNVFNYNYDYDILVLGVTPGGIVDRLGKLPTEGGSRYNLSYYIVRCLKLRITRLNRNLSKDHLIGYIIASK